MIMMMMTIAITMVMKMMIMMMMIMIMTTTTTTIRRRRRRRRRRIAFKSAIPDFYNLITASRTVSNTYAQVARTQSCANHVQHIERSSRATLVRRERSRYCDVKKVVGHPT